MSEKLGAMAVAPVPSGVRPRTVPVQVQRCGGVQCPPGTCNHDEEPVVSRHAQAEASPTGLTAAPLAFADSDGQSLDPGVAGRMSTRFGHDFGSVRIHSGPAAADSARALQADAYTVGRHVVMGEGRYRPGTGPGDQLLAHELVHTIQQVGPHGAEPLAVSSPSDSAEREADELAREVG